MASTYYDDAKRFTSRESIGASEEYSKPVYELEPDSSAKQLSVVTPHPFSRSIEGMTPREVIPTTNRIVIVRNTTDPQDEQGKSIDTSVSSQPKPQEFTPRITDGRTSVYIIRRKIPPEDEKKPTSYYPPVEGSVQNSSTPLEYIQTPSPNPYSLGSRTLTPYRSPTKDPSQALVPSQTTLISSTSYQSTSPQQSSSKRNASNRQLFPSSFVGKEYEETHPPQTRLIQARTANMQKPPQAKSKRPATRKSAVESIDQNRSIGPRVKPVKSAILANPELNTVTLINDPFRRSATNNETSKSLRSDKKIYFKEKQQQVRHDRFSTQSNRQSTQNKYRPLQPNSRPMSISKDINEPSSRSNNMIIEIPECLLQRRQMSPRSHEHKLKQVVKGVNNVIEEAKKRHNGNIPNKVIVIVDDNKTRTT